MKLAADKSLMTTEELLAIPDDGIQRELIRGRLREVGPTLRNYRHASTEAGIASILCNWIEKLPRPRGEICSAKVGMRIRQNPDTTVEIDVAYISAEIAAAHSADAFIIDGVPVLAVEILSPSDKQEDILDKVDDYLACGVKQVWIVEPVYRTVTVYKPGVEPTFFTASQRMNAEPDLSGFEVNVAEFFGD